MSTPLQLLRWTVMLGFLSLGVLRHPHKHKDIDGSNLVAKKARSVIGATGSGVDEGLEDMLPQKALVSVEASVKPRREP
ncbi:hypothetical protein V6N13_126862 [Hibiscus sabdariffa]|uniref:Uncharacterized protein n=1 Tax=Hibiscus sabdariffa TaxID=183260 RepID=A0ABR2RE68_9ROSI